MPTIKSIFAQRIADSKGNSAIETTVILSDGTMGISSVSAATVRSPHEASEIWDVNAEQLRGEGEKIAIDTINSLIATKLINVEFSDQKQIDRTLIDLDGTENKSKLGANSMLSVSQAVLKATAKSSSIPLALYIKNLLSLPTSEIVIPHPIFTLYEGGFYAANKSQSFQEFLLIPASSKSFMESLEIATSVYQNLGQLLKERNSPVLATDEGAYSMSLITNHEALADIKSAIEKSQFKFSLDVFLGIDAAANFLGNDKVYILKDSTDPYKRDDLLEFYKKLQSEFALLYLEDPFQDDDWDGWKKIYAELSSKMLLVGDDLTSTNPYRLAQALQQNVLNGIILKPVQVGTVTEAIAVLEIARFKKLKIIVAERNSDTEDTFIADFAVGVGADYVKFGAPARERAAKYNRILDVQNEIKAFKEKE